MRRGSTLCIVFPESMNSMKWPLVLSILTTLLASRAEGQMPILLWPDGAPGALGSEDKDKPTLTPYLPEPDKASGAAIVVCPGGGYGALASHEGPDYALYLRDQ